MGTNGAVAGGNDAGMRVSVRMTKGKCVRVREGLREAAVAAAEKNEGLRVSNHYIYIYIGGGGFCNFRVTGLYPG